MLDQLSGAQLRSIIESTARLNLWTGPVRSGKTVGSLIRFAEFCVAGPPGPFVVGGRTKDTIKRNVIDPLIEIIGPHAVEYTAGTGELRIAGRLCYVIGANDSKAESKVRGLTAAGAYVDEATILPESYFRMLLSRLSVPGAKLFATTNPDAPRHWLKRDFIDQADGMDLRVFDDFRLEDNPGLDAAYVESLRAEYGPPGSVWFQRYILGRWVLAEGSIWSAFDRDAHTYGDDDVPEGGFSEWWVSVDYGTTNPFVALLLGVGRDDRLYVVREWRWDSQREHRQLTDAEYSKRVRSWLMKGADGALVNSDDEPLPIAPRRILVDPSAASFIVQLWRDKAPNPTKADNAVADGLRWTNSLFGADRVRIHESCSDLMGEIEGYVWDPKALERGEEQPLKQDDHGPDALRYGVMGTRRVWSRWIGATITEGT